MELNDKRALVTGGATGIGYATAQALLAQGSRVLIAGRRAQAIEDAVKRLGSPGRTHGVSADVATTEGRERMLAEARNRLGGLDILVNNAGAVRAGPLEAIPEEEIRQIVEVNLLAPILLTRAALPMLREKGEGILVAVTSSDIGIPFYSTYNAAKAGMSRFNEALRRELLESGVSVITVHPGATDTPMMANSDLASAMGSTLAPPAAVAEALVRAIREGRREVSLAGETIAKMIELNRTDPAALDGKMLAMRGVLAEATRNHKAL